STRNLARTEAPTFWDGDSKPQLLAAAAQPEIESVTKSSEARTGPNLEAKSPKLTSEEGYERVGKELPGHWKDIRAVKRVDYPNADGVVLRRRLQCIIGSNPAIATELNEYIQVLSAEGKALGDFDVSYAPPDEDLEFLDCEVLRPDGKIVRLDPDDIGQSQQSGVGDYQAERRRFFSLPEV